MQKRIGLLLILLLNVFTVTLGKANLSHTNAELVISENIDAISVVQSRRDRVKKSIERKKRNIRLKLVEGYVKHNEKIRLFEFYKYAKVIGRLESSNRYNIVNRYGYAGKYQINPKYFKMFGYNDTVENFLQSPEIQEAVFYRYTQENYRLLKRLGLLMYVGKRIDGVPVTVEGLLASAHLIGAQGLKDAIQGKSKGIDGNRTHFTKYLKQFA